MQATRYEPTPSEIRKACQQIQSRWSEGERQKRSHEPGKRWSPPVVNAGAVDEATQAIATQGP